MKKRFAIFKCRQKSCTIIWDKHWVLSDNGSESIHIDWQAAVDKMNWRIENPDKDVIWI